MPVAYNDQTGEAVRLEGGQWVPTQVAKDDAGNVVIFDGQAWREATPSVLGQRETGEIPAEQTIETTRGAPAIVRRDVGGAPDPVARLETIRQYFPDAQPYGEDNFVFTDPQTGRLTLYNPSGFDIGDIASVTPELAEMGGGSIGAALATMGATPPAVAAAVPTGGVSLAAIPAAALAGYGGGAAAGREFENLIAMHAGQRQDPRALPQRIADAGTTALMNAAAIPAGQAVQNVVGAIAGPVARRITGRTANGGTREGVSMADFEQFGMEPTVGTATGNRALQFLERGAASLPGGAATMQRAFNRQLDDLATAADDIARAYGAPESAQGVGERVRQGARSAITRFETRREQLDDVLLREIGPSTPVGVPSTQRYVARLERELAAAPASRRRELQAAIDRGTEVLADAAQGGMPFSALRSIRTGIGRDVKSFGRTGYTPSEESALQGLYDAVRADIRAAADAAGPRARRALNSHDRYVRRQRMRGGNMELLEKIANQGTDLEAWRHAMAGTKDGGERLARLRQNLTAEEWDVVAGSVLNRLGRRRGDVMEVGDDFGEFSADRFMTEFKNLAPEARRALFSGRRYENLEPELNRLVRLTDRVKQAGGARNYSNTAPVVLSALGLIGGAEATFEGDIGATAASAAGLIVAPKVAAKLLTSPRFVRWIYNAGNPSMNQPKAWARHVARLGNVAGAEPELREAIYQFMQAVRPAEPVGAETGSPPPASPAVATPTQ